MRTTGDYIKQGLAVLLTIYIVYVLCKDIVAGNYIEAVIRYFIIGAIMFAGSCVKAKRVPNPIMIIVWPTPLISQKFRDFMWKEDWGLKIKKFVKRDDN